MTNNFLKIEKSASKWCRFSCLLKQEKAIISLNQIESKSVPLRDQDQNLYIFSFNLTVFILIFYVVSCLLTYQIVITVRFLILKEICNRNIHTDVERVCYCSHKTRLDCPSYSYEMDRCNNYRLFIFGGIWTQQSQNKTMNLKTIKIMSSADVFDAILICELNPSVLFKLKRTTWYVKKRTDWAPSTHKKVFFFEKKHNFPSKNDYRYSRIVTYFYVFIYWKVILKC